MPLESQKEINVERKITNTVFGAHVYVFICIYIYIYITEYFYVNNLGKCRILFIDCMEFILFNILVIYIYIYTRILVDSL